MRGYVVDTNVPVVANGRSKQADADCVIACINALDTVRKDGIIVLDDDMEIMNEYMKNLSLSGQPGAGDMFMKWAWSVQGDKRWCEQVLLTPRYDDSDNYAEFPDDADLARFDLSDRKFVAVALASAHRPEVLNAVDSDWAEHHAALKRAGVAVKFLCMQHVCPME